MSLAKALVTIVLVASTASSSPVPNPGDHQLNFGACTYPAITFNVGFADRSILRYSPIDQSDFKTPPSKNITEISTFICNQLQQQCGANSAAIEACSKGKAAAASQKGGAAADAFNAALDLQEPPSLKARTAPLPPDTRRQRHRRFFGSGPDVGVGLTFGSPVSDTPQSYVPDSSSTSIIGPVSQGQSPSSQKLPTAPRPKVAVADPQASSGTLSAVAATTSAARLAAKPSKDSAFSAVAEQAFDQGVKDEASQRKAAQIQAAAQPNSTKRWVA